MGAFEHSTYTANSASDPTINTPFHFPPYLYSLHLTRDGQIGNFGDISLDGQRLAGCMHTRLNMSVNIWGVHLLTKAGDALIVAKQIAPNTFS